MQIYLAVTPDRLRQALAYTDRPAHVAYRVSSDGRLTRHSLLAATRGGLMVLGDGEQGAVRDAGELCREVWRECGNRGYGGLVADFEGPVSDARTAFLCRLGEVFARNRRQLYVPEPYGRLVPQARVLISTALSGGTLRQRVEEAAESYGMERLAFDLQRLRMDFPLPCPSGEGTPLTGQALASMMEQRTPSVFYSRDLCAKYFTFTQEGEGHFVLFDDGDTILRKIRMGQELGVSFGLLQFPEVEDILPQLFPRQR
ncbi:MAG: hypothetical protein HFF79_04065 [Oscillospiraceae bacterium]|nr:hypothetical protein [Oscillospiraceae bacterium]MCI8878692.1 hypothetical protein [Oscillospiraceae bacterium]